MKRQFTEGEPNRVVFKSPALPPLKETSTILSKIRLCESHQPGTSDSGTAILNTQSLMQ